MTGEGIALCMEVLFVLFILIGCIYLITAPTTDLSTNLH